LSAETFQPNSSPKNAPADPWGGATLEWSIPSPPQEFNFPTLPLVTSSVPLWDLKKGPLGKLPEPQLIGPRLSDFDEMWNRT
jgi:heme/copper-type cytochrome/quinol oxidase subunit 1